VAFARRRGGQHPQAHCVELANAYKYAIESLAVELLPVKDAWKATLAADSASLESLRNVSS